MAPQPLESKSVLRHRKQRGERETSAGGEEGKVRVVRTGRGPSENRGNLRWAARDRAQREVGEGSMAQKAENSTEIKMLGVDRGREN